MAESKLAKVGEEVAKHTIWDFTGAPMLESVADKWKRWLVSLLSSMASFVTSRVTGVGWWWAAVVALVAFAIVLFFQGWLKFNRLVSEARRISKPTSLIGQQADSSHILFDVVRDFATDPTRAGPWCYGYSHTVGGQFVPYEAMNKNEFLGVERLYSRQIPFLGVMHNQTNYTVLADPPTYTVPSNMLVLHPGPHGLCAVVRWTCPDNGRYAFEVAFDGLDKNLNADPEVYIIRNPGEELWRGKLHGYCTGELFEFTKRFQKGDYVDCVVSSGREFGSDSVGLQVRIKVPGN